MGWFSASSAEVLHGLLLIAGVTAACIAAVLVIRRCFPVSAELSRKLLHFTALAILTAWLYAFPAWETAELTMAVFVVVVYAILYLLEKHGALGFFSRVASERKKGELRGSLCAVGFMFMLVAGICWGGLGDRGLALASLYAWGPGDAAAALIGKRYGRTKIGRAKKKSLEGSLAMFALAWLFVFVILLRGGQFSPVQTLAVSVLTAAVTALTELVVLSGFDTFFCPAAAAAVLCLARLLIRRYAA